MKTIQLTQGKVARVDDSDFESLSLHKWYAAKNTHTGKHYAWRGDYALGRKRRKTVHMSKTVLGCTGMVDHINGNTLDNRRSNLRECTNQQNSFNKRKTTKQNGAATQFKGVCWHKRLKKWQANICVNYRKVHIGYFDSPEEAATAYDAAAKRFFGQFAAPNFKSQEL